MRRLAPGLLDLGAGHYRPYPPSRNPTGSSAARLLAFVAAFPLGVASVQQAGNLGPGAIEQRPVMALDHPH
jgi:hypothetical protein